MILLPFLLAQGSPPPAAPSPPVIRTVPAPPPSTWAPTDMVSAPLLLRWQASEMSCGGAPVRPLVAPDPLSQLVYGSARDRGGPYRIAFSIDATGRVVDIKHVQLYPLPPQNDLGPSLAASRFAPGAARTACEAVFTGIAEPLDSAPIAAVIRYTIFPAARPPREAFDRAKPAGSTCFDPAPAVRNRAYPDFKSIPQSPGTLGWTMIGYDIDASGKPVRVRPVASGGNAVLDARAVAAVRESRFEPGARRGCLYPYYRYNDGLPAPEIPIAQDFRPEGSTCPAKPVWVRKPVYSYPDPYRRRSIDGWAVVQYDVAPWGQVGNVRVLAAQPAAAFGDAAKLVLAGASWTPSSGYVGCVDRVRFVMPKAGEADGGRVIAGD